MEDVVIEKKEFGMFSKANLDYKKSKDDGDGKKKKDANGTLSYVFNLVSYFLICFSLLAIDFVLFASSGATNIFSTPSNLIPEALYIIVGIAILVAVLCFVFSFLTILQTIFAAIVVYMTSYAVFEQFANFNSYDGQSGTYISFVFSAISFAILLLGNKSVRALVTLVAVFAFCAVLLQQNKNKEEFLVSTTASVVPVADEDAERMIYFMMPNLPSYAYVNGLTEMEASKPYKDQLMSVILAFYAKNAFKLYPNAYVTQTNPFVNAVLSLNYADEDWKKIVQNQVLKDSYWQFKNRDDFTVYLSKNSMFDELKAKNYQINAYQSRSINLCKKDNKDNVSRCVSKVNLPVNISATPLSLDDRTQVLLGQWLESTGWFARGMDKFYSYAKVIYNPNKTPLLGMSYKNLYVVNSLKTIDNLLVDISQDKGKNAYFVYLDMPADAFVYDEMCRLKNADTWLNKENLPWIEGRNTLEKRNAYLRQTVCLFGKLEQIIETMRKDKLLDNTTIIIQGLNGADDLDASAAESQAESFKNIQMVNMAIREPKSGKFIINKAICSVPNILKSFFSGNNSCEEFAGTSLSKTSKNAISLSLSLVKFSNDIAQRSLQAFNIWYKEWKKANPIVSMPKTENSVGILSPSSSKREFDALPPAEGPKLLPMEEKVISKSNIMSGQVNVKPEDSTRPISQAGGM